MARTKKPSQLAIDFSGISIRTREGHSYGSLGIPAAILEKLRVDTNKDKILWILRDDNTIVLKILSPKSIARLVGDLAEAV